MLPALDALGEVRRWQSGEKQPSRSRLIADMA